MNRVMTRDLIFPDKNLKSIMKYYDSILLKAKKSYGKINEDSIKEFFVYLYNLDEEKYLQITLEFKKIKEYEFVENINYFNACASLNGDFKNIINILNDYKKIILNEIMDLMKNDTVNSLGDILNKIDDEFILNIKNILKNKYNSLEIFYLEELMNKLILEIRNETTDYIKFEYEKNIKEKNKIYYNYHRDTVKKETLNQLMREKRGLGRI